MGLKRVQRILFPFVIAEEIIVVGIQQNRACQLVGPVTTGVYKTQLRSENKAILPQVQ
jgi:hypothetical protein